MLAAAAVVTERGGHTSHDAVVARGLGRPAVTALDATVDHTNERVLCVTGDPLRQGDVVTVDGATGQVHRGGMSNHETGMAQDLRAWLTGVLADADSIEVRVNADSAESAAHGLTEGAEGVGLCRVEHAFLGERQRLLERALMSVPGPDRNEAVQLIGTVLRDDLIELLRVMDGRPVTIRLLDPPRHEFLPDLVDLAFEVARTEMRGQHTTDRDRFDLLGA